jgi:hypothetical protein
MTSILWFALQWLSAGVLVSLVWAAVRGRREDDPVEDAAQDRWISDWAAGQR